MAKEATELQNQIRLEASMRGHRVFVNVRGRGYHMDKKTPVTFGVGPNGASDLIGWNKRGLFAAIEVKAGDDKPRDDQIKFIEAVKAAGGVAGIAYNVADAIRILDGDL